LTAVHVLVLGGGVGDDEADVCKPKVEDFIHVDPEAVVDMDDIGSSVAKIDGGRAECLLCYKTFSKMCHAKRHVETVHARHEAQECFACQSRHKNVNALNDHLRRVHKIYQSDLDVSAAAAENPATTSTDF
jgi:hypothetical protein